MACRKTGLDDLGDDLVFQRLAILLNSLKTDARLNFFGRICAHSDILRLLCSRIQLVEARKRHPEIAEQRIRRPLFITGLPRTGSTLLHALLGQDPAARVPKVWEVMHPFPPPETASYHDNPSIGRTAKDLKWFNLLVPEFKKVHLIDARLPQECIAIMAHAFLSYVFESIYFAASYRIWHEDQDKTPAYVLHRRFLQHLQWRCPGHHWVLKAPSHLLALDALSRIYPDAGIIMTHRDPLKVLGSCSSFTEVLRSPFTDSFDRAQLGREVAWRWEKGARLAIQFRQRSTPLSGRFLDVHYADLTRDPMATVKVIYDTFELPLSEEAVLAMKRFLARNPQGKNGAHHYTLDDYGLQRAGERQRFQFYTDYFGIEPEIL